MAAKRALYEDATVQKAKRYRETVNGTPTDVFYGAMEARALYTVEAKRFYVDHLNDTKAMLVYRPIFDQLTRCIESIGKNLADMHGHGGDSQAVQSCRVALGSAYESVYFLSCLPPPFSTRLLACVEKLKPRIIDILRRDILARKFEKSGRTDKEAKKSVSGWDEILERLEFPPPPVYEQSSELSKAVIDAALVYLYKDCDNSTLDLDGPTITALIEHITCVPANIIEGHGQFGLAKQLSFVAHARSGLWKYICRAPTLPPPFSTVLQTKATTLLVRGVEELLEHVTMSIIEGHIVPV